MEIDLASYSRGGGKKDMSENAFCLIDMIKMEYKKSRRFQRMDDHPHEEIHPLWGIRNVDTKPLEWSRKKDERIL